MESRGKGRTSWIFRKKKRKISLFFFSLKKKKGLKKEKKLKFSLKAIPSKGLTSSATPKCFSMGVCYPSSLVLMLIAPSVGQDLCLPSAAQKQNRIVSAARSLNPTLLLLIFLGILSPVTYFVTRVLSACGRWELSAAGRLSFTMLY